MNTDVLNIKVSTKPFHIIPLWLSFYFTHPGAVYNGLVDFAAAIDSGYELHTGEIQVSYYINSLVPKVSLSDYESGTLEIPLPWAPGTTFASNAGGVNGRDWNVDPNGQRFPDPFLSFDLLDWLIKEYKVRVINYNSFHFFPIVGDIYAA